MIGNQSGRPYSRERHWREFDQLTPRLRRLMAHAPYDYVTDFVLRALKERGEGAAASEFIAECFRSRDTQLKKKWSPDHPMIGARTPERRPERRLAL